MALSDLLWRKIEIASNIDSIPFVLNLGSGIVLCCGSDGTGDGDIYRSTDYAETWTKVRDLGTEVVYSLADLGSGIVIGGTGNTAGAGNIERSTNYGSTWSTIEYNAASGGTTAVCSLGSGIVLLGTGGAGAGNGEIWRSTDSGVNWTKVYDPGALKQIKCFLNLGSNIVLAGSGDGATDSDIYRSTDNGVNWTKVELSATNTNAIVSMCDLGSGIVLAGASGSVAGGGTLYRSVDYGVTWSSGTIDSSVDAINFLYKDVSGNIFACTGYGVGDGTVWYSTDNGVTWGSTSVNTALTQSTSIAEIRTGQYAIGTGNGSGLGDVWISYYNPILSSREYQIPAGSTSYTMIMWYKSSQATWGIIAKIGELSIYLGTPVSNTTIGLGNNSVNIKATGSNLDNGSWHLIALQNTAGVFKVAVDNGAYSSTFSAPDANLYDLAKTNKIQIGGNKTFDTYDVRLYNKALTIEQVDYYYNETLKTNPTIWEY
jgi:hypothetical protein